MTNKEAIKIIMNYDELGCGYCHQGGDEIKEAFEMAVEALSKQIAKKPVFKDDGYDFYRSINIYGIYCPTCKELVLGYTDNELTDDCDGILENDFFKSKEIDFSEIRKHNCCCSCCGQKLSWSDC